MHRIIFTIGPFTLYSYGLFVAAAFLVGVFLIVKDAGKQGISRNDILDVMVSILLGGLIGGRLLYVALNWEHYIANPVQIIKFQEGGLAYQGAFVFAAIAGIFMARLKKIDFWRGSDLIMPYVALGQALGRMGCFLNGCCYGNVVDSGLAVTFPGETVMRAPTQLYSSLMLIVIFVALRSFSRKKPFEGYVFVMYLLFYGMLRFFMDFFRGDELSRIGVITLSQGISVGMFVVGLVILGMKIRKATRDR